MFKFKPYYLFIIAAASLFIAGWFISHSTMDIHLHDTYFVFSSNYFAWFLSILLIGFFLIYLATNTILFSKKLSWVHICITIACLAVLVLPFNVRSNEGMAGMPRRYYEFDSAFSRYYYLYKQTPVPVIVTFAFIFAQLLYFVNLFVGLTRQLIGKRNK